MNRRLFFRFLGIAPMAVLARPEQSVASVLDTVNANIALRNSAFARTTACSPSLSLISNNAATARVVQQLKEQLAKHKREIPGIIMNTIHDAKCRRVD